MEKSNVPALSRGLYLIELIADSGAMSFGELEKESGLNTSSLNRLLKELVESHFIAKNQDGKYMLGLKLFTIAYHNSVWQPLYQVISNILHEISEAYKVTTLLYLYLPEGISILDKVVYPDNVAMRKIGEVKRDYLLSPWGFLYLAQMEEPNRSRFARKTMQEAEKDVHFLPIHTLNRLVEFSMKRGYADDEAIIIKNVRRMAVPIYGRENDLLAALAVGSFSESLNESKTEDMINSLKQKANYLSGLIKGTEKGVKP